MKTFLLIASFTLASAQFGGFNGQQGTNQNGPTGQTGQNRPEPPFLQNLPQEAKTAFMNIVQDSTLTPDQKHTAIEELAAKYGVTLPPKPEGQEGGRRHHRSTEAPFGQFGNAQFGFGGEQGGEGRRRGSTEAPQFGGFGGYPTQNNGGFQGSNQGSGSFGTFGQGSNQGSFPGFGQNQGTFGQGSFSGFGQPQGNNQAPFGQA